MARGGLPGLNVSLRALSGDGSRSSRSLFECRKNDFVRVGEAGLLTGERPHTDALFDARRAVLDDPVFQRPRLLAGELEIHVCEIHRCCRTWLNTRSIRVSS